MTKYPAAGRPLLPLAVVAALALLAPAIGASANGPGTWSSGIAALQTARIWFTATLLTTGPNAGKVLAAGGRGASGSYLNSAELYDPVANTWTLLSHSMIASSGYRTATPLTTGPNAGKILFAGGYNGTSSIMSVEMYDPVNDTWIAAAPLSHARDGHTATLLSDGRILVAGGYNSASGTCTTTAEVYNPSTNAWTDTGLMNQGREYHTATLLTSGPNAGDVLVASGDNCIGAPSTSYSSAELYNPNTNTWTLAASLNTARTQHTAIVLTTGPHTGDVFVAGGKNGNTVLRSAELYDPTTTTWTLLSNLLTTARTSHTATLLNDGSVLLAGGYDGTNSVSSAEVYDPVSGTSSATSNAMSSVHYIHTATLLPSGAVLVAGGCGNPPCTVIANADLYQGPAGNGGGTATPELGSGALLLCGLALLLAVLAYRRRTGTPLMPQG